MNATIPVKATFVKEMCDRIIQNRSAGLRRIKIIRDMAHAAELMDTPIYVDVDLFRLLELSDH